MIWVRLGNRTPNPDDALEHEPLPLELGLSTKVDEQPDPASRRLQVVQNLSSMVVTEIADSLNLKDDFSKALKVGDVNQSQCLVLVTQLQLTSWQ